MESATFRKWLMEQGCRFDRHEHEHRHEVPVMVTVHRDGRKAEVPLGGSRHPCCPLGLRRAWVLTGLSSQDP